MKKIILLSTILVLSLVLAACQPSVDQAKADFCEDLGAFAQAQLQFRQVNATTTKGELNQAVSDLEDAWNDLQNSAATLQEVQLGGVQDALENLKRDIQNIDNDATLAEGEAQIKSDVVATMGETLKISTTVCSYGQDQ